MPCWEPEAARDGRLGSALHHAAAADQTEAAQLLLLGGAEADIK